MMYVHATLAGKVLCSRTLFKHVSNHPIATRLCFGASLIVKAGLELTVTPTCSTKTTTLRVRIGRF